ncbi:MAG: LysR family transcriptional regulator [Chloroflexota bacterium]|nr:LysR family transcriptional regulator [Chloroflexota bacterium]
MITESDHWLGVEVRHFAALQAIAAEGSFRQAAMSLGYTQSAVSQQIATLERLVGERLIDRPGGPRPVSLTEAGMLLLRHAEAILARIHAAQADLAALTAGIGGSLRVGTYQSVGSSLLPILMREFTAAWPRLEIRLTESTNDEGLLPGIECGELDLAFAIFPLPPGPFEGVELLCDPYVLVVAADSPLATKGRPLALNDIAQLPLIGFRQCRSMAWVELHLAARGMEAQIIFRSDDNGTVQGLVAAGMGVALVPRLTVKPDDRRIVVLDLEDDIPPRHIALVWHRDRYRSPAARAFVEAAQTVCANLITGDERKVGIADAGRWMNHIAPSQSAAGTSLSSVLPAPAGPPPLPAGRALPPD